MYETATMALFEEHERSGKVVAAAAAVGCRWGKSWLMSTDSIGFVSLPSHPSIESKKRTNQNKDVVLQFPGNAVESLT